MKIKNYFFFLIYLFLNPRLLPLFLRRVYPPVFLQYEWLKNYPINTVIDVGAYHGHVSKTLNFLFPKAKIYAFEPIKENCKIISAKITSPHLTVIPKAISRKNGTATFYQSRPSFLSSLLPSQYLPHNHKTTSPAKAIKVETTTLDTYFKNKKLPRQIFLKLDTQGTEGHIIEGGKTFLKNVSIIHVETAFREFYQGEYLFDKVYYLLTNLGFKYIGEIRESEFYPRFNLGGRVNSIFIAPQVEPPNTIF